MITIINEFENKMWQAAQKGDKSGFLQLVEADAVMICGGFRCTGADYAEFIQNFGIVSYEISCFEIILEAENAVQVHYIVKTTADSSENADLAGTFNVVSTWILRNGIWKLVFNMDSRVYDENN